MTANTVLILTALEDETADAVEGELSKRDVRVVRMDTGDFPTLLNLSADHDGYQWQGRLWNGQDEVDFNSVTSVYYRRPTRFRMPEGVSDGDAVFAGIEARLGFGGVLATIDATWVNDPARVAIAEYKPLQLKVASRAGLAVPRTLVTNDHASVVKFSESIGGGELICKTFSSLVLSVDDIPQGIYTTPVKVADIDPAALAVTTHLIQERLTKAYEVRVTMVGRKPYAAKIMTSSEAGQIDWRIDYASLTYETIETPKHITGGMIRYLEMLGLNYGAFDFIVTPEEGWIMLECNPSGQWLWLEEDAGLPISSALADLLAEGVNG